MMKKLLVVLMSISMILSFYQLPEKAEAATTQTAYQQFSHNLSRDLNSYIKKSGGDIRLQYRDLSSGDEYRLNNTAGTVRAASTIKLPLVLQVMELASQGKLNLNEKLTYKHYHYNGGSGIIQKAKVGTQYTIRELVRITVTYSDNIGFVMLRERVGKQNFINYMRKLGGKYTYTNGVNTTSASDMVAYWNDLYNFSQRSPLGKELINYLKHTIYNTTIPTGTRGAEVAHKVGMIPESGISHDVGIVYDRNPYILAIMTNRLSYAKSQKTIADLASIVYKYHKQKSTAQYIAAKTDQDLIQYAAGKAVKIGTVIKGENFKISADKGDWYEIDFGGNKALISKKGVVTYYRPFSGYFFNGKSSVKGQIIVQPNAALYNDPTGKGRKIATVSFSKAVGFDSTQNNFYKVNFGDRYAYIEKTKADLQFTPTIKYVQINKDNTPVISKTSGMKIAVLSKGKIFIRIKDSGSYQEVQYGNITAYIPKTNVLPVYETKITNPTSTAPAANLVELSNDTKGYWQMNSAAQPSAILLKGQKINYIQKNGTWYSINLAGRIVYFQQAMESK